MHEKGLACFGRCTCNAGYASGNITSVMNGHYMLCVAHQATLQDELHAHKEQLAALDASITALAASAQLQEVEQKLQLQLQGAEVKLHSELQAVQHQLHNFARAGDLQETQQELQAAAQKLQATEQKLQATEEQLAAGLASVQQHLGVFAHSSALVDAEERLRGALAALEQTQVADKQHQAALEQQLAALEQSQEAGKQAQVALEQQHAALEQQLAALEQQQPVIAVQAAENVTSLRSEMLDAIAAERIVLVQVGSVWMLSRAIICPEYETSQLLTVGHCGQFVSSYGAWADMQLRHGCSTCACSTTATYTDSCRFCLSWLTIHRISRGRCNPNMEGTA